MTISIIAAWITVIVFTWNVTCWVWKKFRKPICTFLKAIISFIIRFLQHIRQCLEKQT